MSTVINLATKKVSVLDVVRPRSVDCCGGESVAYKQQNGASPFVWIDMSNTTKWRLSFCMDRYEQ